MSSSSDSRSGSAIRGRASKPGASLLGLRAPKSDTTVPSGKRGSVEPATRSSKVLVLFVALLFRENYGQFLIIQIALRLPVWPKLK